MKTAAISGGLGDTIYALPILHKLGVKRLYVKQVALEDGSDTYTALRDLIQLQGIECLPTDGAYPLHEFEPGLQFDYNLDNSRRQMNRGHNHIIRSFMQEFGVFIPTWREPWLIIDNEPSVLPGHRTMDNDTLGTDWKPTFVSEPYALISVTPRWRDGSRVDWRKIYEAIPPPVYFIGFGTDWMTFTEEYGSLPWIATPTLLDAARVIRDASTVYLNQSSLLTIVQGLGKNYWLEHKPFRTNTLLGTKNERLLK
jgi:hypothetical protein